MQAGEGQREKETEDPKQAAESPTQGSNSQGREIMT